MQIFLKFIPIQSQSYLITHCNVLAARTERCDGAIDAKTGGWAVAVHRLSHDLQQEIKRGRACGGQACGVRGLAVRDLSQVLSK